MAPVEMERRILSYCQSRPLWVMSPRLVASIAYKWPTPSPCSGSCPLARNTLFCQMTGVEMTSLRVFGQTASLGFMSNSQSFLPVSASYPRAQPSPSPMTTCTTSPICPTAAEDHWPCRIFSPTLFTSHASLPVFLLTAIMDGARGDGMCTWLSSCPLEVLTKTRSPKDTGDELDMLCGEEPTSSIMSNFQITLAPPLPSPRVSRQTSSQRLET